MTELFAGIEVEIIMDDILVHGKTLESHNRTLEEVLKRCKEKNLKFNKDKIRLAQKKVEYVGQILTPNGISEPLRDLIKHCNNWALQCSCAAAHKRRGRNSSNVDGWPTTHSINPTRLEKIRKKTIGDATMQSTIANGWPDAKREVNLSIRQFLGLQR
ncbi:hypothetical protein CAPTEDRAFT_218132 [Capitella teleta]|uniref:Reverse transcriptase domain-containing protein n=1 Tax=Capitella teleta TaxID=283909 RepID=R7TH73_CAPTE|nr:hypothetical protein CAPTEDRAFT_218132 [Capitella teleta]|eukprot:ELT93059.1 hypothetical protein CAPTEDRAFT_218132 [Capitella teleta]